MKVILNKDLAPLGEEGDVKEVAKGYARNFLFPRGIAMPYTDKTVAILESRREEIEARKEEKRKDALGIKEKLEELDLVIAMPAGANGRLYGAVTSQTIADELAKQGFPVERKRIELPGNSFKSVGKYKVSIKLYESAAAELTITVEGQQIKVETPASPARRERRRRDEAPVSASAEAATETAAETAAAVSTETSVETAAVPVGGAPAEEASETPVGGAPVEEAPGASVGEAPAGEASETPVGEAPAGEAPETPVGEAPVEEAPAASDAGALGEGEPADVPESGSPKPAQEASGVEA